MNVQINTAKVALSSFLILYSNTKIGITDCSFINVKGIGSGAVFKSENDYSEIKFLNATFKNNSAHQGGLFKIAKGNLFCIECKMVNNFGVEGGILHLSSDGKIHFDNSVFEQNSAVAYSFSIQESIWDSLVSNSNFSSNKVLT